MALTWRALHRDIEITIHDPQRVDLPEQFTRAKPPTGGHLFDIRFIVDIAEGCEPDGRPEQQIGPTTFRRRNAMFATPRNKRTITATTFAGAFVVATLAGAGLVAAQPAKFVKLNYRNASKIEIQVYTVDNVSKKTVEKKNQITPGGSDSSQAMVDKDGNIDVLFSIVGKNDKGASEYRCKPVKTSAASAPSTTALEFEKLSRC